MDNQSLFSKYFNRVLKETMTTASVGMGATSDTVFGGRDDSAYAPGDARMPTVLGAKRAKKNKKKKLKESEQPKARVNKQGLMGSASREHKVKKGKGSFKRRQKHQKKLTDGKVPAVSQLIPYIRRPRSGAL